eukprot:1140710-Pelagomonas_calceolata.AAC.4
MSLARRQGVLPGQHLCKACCLDNVCPHRGAPLGKGWLKDIEDPNGDLDTCVVCPYHGWAFNAEGACTRPDCSRNVRISPPSGKDGAFASGCLAAPGVACDGLIPYHAWSTHGKFAMCCFCSAMPPEERPPIPFVPELEDPGWQPVFGACEWISFIHAFVRYHIFSRCHSWSWAGASIWRGLPIFFSCVIDMYGPKAVGVAKAVGRGIGPRVDKDLQGGWPAARDSG